MHIPEEAPPLNPWPFLIGDAVLIAAATLIASEAPTPLTALPLIIIALCLILGSFLAITPFLLNFTRSQETALDQRQREIAALAQSTASSAEQISIAVSNLHAISESSARALKLVESLPHKLQEKVNEFKTQLNEVAVTENESLAQEINTLRTSETERLETALVSVRKTAAEIFAFEASFKKQLKELNDLLQKSAQETAKAVSTTAQTLDASRSKAESALAEAQTRALAAIQESIEAALSRLPNKLPGAPAPVPVAVPEKTVEAEAPAKIAPELIAIPTPLPSPIAEAEQESAPVATAVMVEAPVEVPTTPSAEPALEDVPTPVERPIRKKALRKTEPEPELSLGLEIQQPSDTYNQVASEPAESAVSADGMTRLIVTAYIGIGNKLYVRGEGPGLSWERGVPLQFVSIGKWRWESAEVAAPVKLKLLKNDTTECPVGTITIEPGHQSEVVANFA
jgi:hypothetical protein